MIGSLITVLLNFALQRGLAVLVLGEAIIVHDANCAFTQVIRDLAIIGAGQDD